MALDLLPISYARWRGRFPGGRRREKSRAASVDNVVPVDEERRRVPDDG
jgi:hypothetical protein